MAAEALAVVDLVQEASAKAVAEVAGAAPGCPLEMASAVPCPSLALALAPPIQV